MHVKKILITGDDGRRAIGTRLLVRFLKDGYKLSIVETKVQQSGVGGKIHLAKTIKWGEHTIDGVTAVWVDGSPADAIEFAHGYFGDEFDLIISGINLGANISGAAISSGTLAAAWRGVNIPMAKQALVISWDLPAEYFFLDHEGVEDIQQYLDYPGLTVAKIVELAIKNNLWGCKLLNINLPKEKSQKIRFTKFMPRISDFYVYPVNIDEKSHSFSYGNKFAFRGSDLDTDGGATRNGCISITPCKVDMLDDKIYQGLKNKTIDL